MTRAIEVPFPLRRDFTAQVIVPHDLTIAEVRRLAAMLETLVTPARDSVAAERGDEVEGA